MLQLYMVACQIKWNDVNRFKDVIFRPGIMHTTQSFSGCIGKLMCGSGVESLISSAFGGLAGIMSGKSWVRSMRAFRMVSTALLNHFLNTGPKTFDELSDYVDTCRQHPTGRHWVDNLIKPTLLIHQLLRSEREGDFCLQQLTLERMLPYFFRSWPPPLRPIHHAAPSRDAVPVATDSQIGAHGWCLRVSTPGG